MRIPWDHHAKLILDVLLSERGEFATGYEVASADPQYADVWFAPDPAHDAVRRADLGLLARITDGACVLEPFSTAPSEDDCLALLRKVLTLRHHEWRRAVREQRTPRPPLLWALCAERPTKAIRALAMRRDARWPTGVYRMPTLIDVHVVVLRELPRTTDTLPLRLLGRGPTRRDALADLLALPASTAWRERLLGLLVEVVKSRRLSSEARPEDDKEDAAMVDLSGYWEWKKQVLAEGKAEGKAEGVAKVFQALERLYERRLGRALRPDESATLLVRLDTLGAARIGDVVLDLEADALARWIAAPDAS